MESSCRPSQSRSSPGNLRKSCSRHFAAWFFGSQMSWEAFSGAARLRFVLPEYLVHPVGVFSRARPGQREVVSGLLMTRPASSPVRALLQLRCQTCGCCGSQPWEHQSSPATFALQSMNIYLSNMPSSQQKLKVLYSFLSMQQSLNHVNKMHNLCPSTKLLNLSKLFQRVL